MSHSHREQQGQIIVSADFRRGNDPSHHRQHTDAHRIQPQLQPQCKHCHGLKGGIGSASRVGELDGEQYTIGALVLSNHAVFDDLVVAGTPIQSLLDAHIPPHEDKGSIITVLATDIPLSERQLRRLCHRALVGLSRTGSFCGNGSGEIVIAFTTANRVPHYSEKAILPMGMVHDDAINPLFRAVAECVEESVLSSLLHAETVTGYHGRTVRCLSDLLDEK